MNETFHIIFFLIEKVKATKYTLQHVFCQYNFLLIVQKSISIHLSNLSGNFFLSLVVLVFLGTNFLTNFLNGKILMFSLSNLPSCVITTFPPILLLSSTSILIWNSDIQHFHILLHLFFLPCFRNCHLPKIVGNSILWVMKQHFKNRTLFQLSFLKLVLLFQLSKVHDQKRNPFQFFDFLFPC